MLALPVPPSQLANKVIKQMIEHLFTDDMVVEKQDFLAIRTVFRKLGGTWEAFIDGDNAQIDRLSQIVAAWGQMPGRKKHSDDLL